MSTIETQGGDQRQRGTEVAEALETTRGLARVLLAGERGSGRWTPRTWLAALAWLNFFALMWAVLLGLVPPGVSTGVAVGSFWVIALFASLARK